LNTNPSNSLFSLLSAGKKGLRFSSPLSLNPPLIRKPLVPLL